MIKRNWIESQQLQLRLSPQYTFLLCMQIVFQFLNSILSLSFYLITELHAVLFLHSMMMDFLGARSECVAPLQFPSYIVQLNSHERSTQRPSWYWDYHYMPPSSLVYLTISWIRVCNALQSTSRNCCSVSNPSKNEVGGGIEPMTTGPESNPSIWYKTFEKGMNAQ